MCNVFSDELNQEIRYERSLYGILHQRQKNRDSSLQKETYGGKRRSLFNIISAKYGNKGDINNNNNNKGDKSEQERAVGSGYKTTKGQ